MSKKIVGDYHFSRFLGKGQFGEVWQALHNNNPNRAYAVKCIKKSEICKSKKMMEQFDTEIKVMKTLNHPNLLHCHDFLETGSNYYAVIDQCPDGDLEGHIEKFGTLCEKESVYFQKQIMNGFRELHKHKIMHRDFKPANIFQNNDQVVIGDFGFAKMGVTHTSTNLGTPITMAPELLKKVKVFSDKIDLWSIGIVFYNMLYGKIPFDFSTYQGLVRATVDQSGKNLHFPHHIEVSNQAKDLLKQLIEPDPLKRISWDGFFQHKLFSMGLHMSVLPDNQANLNASIAFHGNVDKVERQFSKNAETRNKTVEYIEDITKIDYEQMRNNCKPRNQTDKSQRFAINNARSKYNHEKKIIVYLAKSSVHMRGLCKDACLKHLDINFMNASIVLIKYCHTATQNMIETLTYQNNLYKLEGFIEHFLPSSECQQYLAQLLADVEHYQKLLEHLTQKLPVEFKTKTEKVMQVYKNAEQQGLCKTTLLNEVKNEYKAISSFYTSNTSLIESLGSGVKYAFKKAIVDLWRCFNCETEFKYRQDEGNLFNWGDFTRECNNPDAMSRRLEELIEQKLSGYNKY